MKQIATMKQNGVYKVILDETAKMNPYKVIYKYRELTDHGVVGRQRILQRYADLKSAMAFLTALAR